jgi:hypothetical protein
MNKLTDKIKVERAKKQLLRALEEVRNNSNKVEVLGFVTGQIAHTFAMLDANKDDEMGIVFVAVSILDEINPKERKPILSAQPQPEQLKLPEGK